MMRSRCALLALAMMIVVAPAVRAQDSPQTEDQPDLTGIKCVVKGERAANPNQSAEFEGGTVYFCCAGCKKKFESDPAAFMTKAHHQLVATGQYVQKACPMSGKPCSEGKTAKVGGVEVGVCCDHCLAMIENADSTEAKAELVFAKKPFAKGFEKKQAVKLKGVKCMMMPKKDVKPDQFAKYRDGKVFFCCKGCKGKFQKHTDDYATQANQQLVATGQYVQKGCPISGGSVDDEQVVEVNGIKVKVCCEKCAAKIKGADDDAARAEMVFGNAAFEKGFEKKK